jgi:hypothetical protein
MSLIVLMAHSSVFYKSTDDSFRLNVNWFDIVVDGIPAKWTV